VEDVSSGAEEVASTIAKAGLTTTTPSTTKLTMKTLETASAVVRNFMHSVYYQFPRALANMGIAHRLKRVKWLISTKSASRN